MADRNSLAVARAPGHVGRGPSLRVADAGAQAAPGGYWPHATTALIVLFALVSVRVHELFPYLFGPLRPALTVAIPLTLLLFARTSPKVVAAAFQYRQTRLLIAFIAFALVTVPLAFWPGKAFSTVRGMIPALLLFMGCMLVRPARTTLDRVQLGFVALVLFFATYQKIFGQSWAGRLRPLGGSYDLNDTAALMAMAFPLAAGILVRAQRGRPRILAALAVMILVLVIIATGSRGGTLALLAGAVVFAAAMRGPRALLVWIGMVAGGLAAWSQATPEFRARMLSLTNLEQDYNYTSDVGRKAVWERGRGYWRSNPIAGVGAGNFTIAEGEFNAETGRTGKWSAAHNAYIQALAELGTVGGGLFIAMMLTAAAAAWPLWRQAPGRGPPRLYRPELLASLASAASSAYFLSHAYFSPLYGLLGMIALADRTAAAEKSGAGVLADGADQRRTVRSAGQRGGLAFVRLAAGPARRGGMS